MKKFCYPILILFYMFFFSGCAMVSHVPLSKQDNASIKTVYVDPEIKKPADMYEFVSGAQLGVPFGLAGGLAGSLASANAARSTQEFAEKNKVNIEQIVYEAWKNKLSEKTKFKLSNQPTDVVLKTDIIMYGISIPHGFSTDYVPVLAFNAKLVRNNQVLWQDSGRVNPLTGGLPRYKMDQIIRDPKKLRAMWEKASEKIINEMLDEMSK